jgi:hypothetical protein
MTRSLVFVPILLAACSVGTFGETTGGDDTGTPDSGGGGDDRNLCVDKGTPPAPYTHTGADGQPATPRSGMGCMNAGCHDGTNQMGATKFGFSGTVYKEPADTTPQPGVTVRIFPGSAPNKSIATAITDTAGNFIIRGTYESFPYQTDTTACGTDAQAMGIRTMVGAIGRGDQNCNAGNTCHQAAPAVSATPVYLMD